MAKDSAHSGAQGSLAAQETNADRPLSMRGGVLWQRLHAPVDVASLVYFRIAFYGILVWES